MRQSVHDAGSVVVLDRVPRVMLRRLMILILITTTLAASCTILSAAEPSTDEAYLAGLRQRRFFRLATVFAEQKLADSSLSADEALDIVIELSRTHAAWALHEPPATRAAKWQQADGILARFRQQHADHARLLLLNLQAALNQLARGELLRQEAEVAGGDFATFEPAREALRGAINGLEALDAKFATPGRDTTAWTNDERLSLRDQIRWQLARALKNQALSYPAGSADRVASLTAAMEPLTGLMRELPPASSLYWPTRLDAATCQRLLGDHVTAVRSLEAILAADAPPRITLRARAEMAELHLERGEYDAVLTLLGKGRVIGSTTSPEFDLVYLRSYLALWKKATEEQKPSDAKAWLDKAEQVARLMEQTHGAYWRRRSDLLLAAAARGGNADGNMSVLLRTADNLYVRKQYAEAIKAYADAARAAEAAGETTTALSIWKKAAAVHQQQMQPAIAAALLADAAVRLRDDGTSAEAHRAAILLAARAASAEAANLTLYESLMAQHLDHWPAAATANGVRLWQGKLAEHRREFDAASVAYTGVAGATADQLLAAVAGTARVYAARIEAADEKPAKEQLATEALNYFANVVQASSARSDLSPVYQAAAVAQARFELQYLARPDYRRVEQTVGRALAGDNVSPDVAREAESLLIVALAAQPARRGEALQRLRRLGNTQPEQMLSLLDQLSKLSAGFNEASRREIAALVLEVSDSLLGQNATLSEAQRDAVQRRRADALINAGRGQEATSLLADLAKRHPRDATIQEAYAKQLVTSNDRQSLTLALEKWRFISKHTRPATERWWRAKYSIALAHYRLGDSTEAAKLLRYAQATGAGEPSEKLAGEIEALLKQTGR